MGTVDLEEGVWWLTCRCASTSTCAALRPSGACGSGWSWLGCCSGAGMTSFFGRWRGRSEADEDEDLLDGCCGGRLMSGRGGGWEFGGGATEGAQIGRAHV